MVDTNVFVSQLSQAEKLSELTDRLILFVPWSVLHELDSLAKSGKEIQLMARKSISFLQSHLGDKNSRVRTQNVFLVLENLVMRWRSSGQHCCSIIVKFRVRLQQPSALFSENLPLLICSVTKHSGKN